MKEYIYAYARDICKAYSPAMERQEGNTICAYWFKTLILIGKTQAHIYWEGSLKTVLYKFHNKTGWHIFNKAAEYFYLDADPIDQTPTFHSNWEEDKQRDQRTERFLSALFV